MTTWRFESMWTRTLSICISTSPAMRGLSHRARTEASPGRAGSDDPQQHADDEPEHEAPDVREERDTTLGGLRAEGREPAQELQPEPEAQDDERGHLEQLVEEAQEHQ